MSNIMKDYVSQNVQEYNRTQELGLTEQEQEKVVEGILDDPDVLFGYVMKKSKLYNWETFLAFVSKHVNIIIGERNSDDNK